MPTNTQDTEAERERLAHIEAEVARIRGVPANEFAAQVSLLADEIAATSDSDWARDEALVLIAACALRREPGSEPVAWQVGTRLHEGVPPTSRVLWGESYLTEAEARSVSEVVRPVYAEPPAPVVGPVGEEWLFELLAAFRSGEKTAHETVAALLDAHRRGGAVGGDEAWTKEYERLREAFYMSPIPHLKANQAALDAHVLSRPSGSGDELLGGDGRYAELSAADEADARRCAGILAEKYDIVRIAQDHGTGNWSVVYTHPRALAVQPEKEER